jgi:hypothetical protein
MSPEPHYPQVTIPPEEDARLAPLEGDIEYQWREFRPRYFQKLQENGQVESAIHQMALTCIRVLHQYQNKGLGADQGREAIQPLIVPEPEK